MPTYGQNTSLYSQFHVTSCVTAAQEESSSISLAVSGANANLDRCTAKKTICKRSPASSSARNSRRTSGKGQKTQNRGHVVSLQDMAVDKRSKPPIPGSRARGATTSDRQQTAFNLKDGSSPVPTVHLGNLGRNAAVNTPLLKSQAS